MPFYNIIDFFLFILIIANIKVYHIEKKEYLNFSREHSITKLRIFTDIQK